MIGETQMAAAGTVSRGSGVANRLTLLAPAWYGATELRERIEASTAGWRETVNDAIDGERAVRRWQRWRSEPPFTDDALFARRLATDGIGEEDFLHLLGEPLEAVRDRSLDPPGWLRELTEAFAHTSSVGYPEAPPERRQDGFLRLAAPLARLGRERLRQGVQELARARRPLPFDPETVEYLLAVELPDSILRMVTRTLVLELHVARLQGLLEGESAEERFGSFIERLADPDNALAILEEYPVLARQLTVYIGHWVAASLEFLERLCADWEAIRATFSPGKEPGRLMRVEGGAGDKHRGGRSVLIAEFSSGLKVVYKPRPLSLDVHFQELLNWINGRSELLPLRTVKVLDRGTHGWVQFIAAQPCSSTAELRRFYRRQGSYLALLYALEATDFHRENLIAAGEHPVLLDLEALFHPRIAGADGPEASRRATDKMEKSVLRVGLLPQRVWSNAESVGVDMSGLGGSAGQLTPFDVPSWEGTGTDDMRLVRKRVTMPGSQNRPTLDLGRVDPLDYVDAIVDGFTRMYRFLLRNREELLAPNGPLAHFVGDEVRVVLRGTQTYATLLHESFHPDVLRDALDRDRLFDRLWVQVKHLPHLARVISAERRDLAKGDIPLFFTRPASCDLFTSSQERLPDFFDEPAIATVRRRLEHMSEEDLLRQVWFVRASLATLANPLDRARWPRRRVSRSPRSSSDRARLLGAARAIGDRLEALVLRGEEDVSWIGLSLAEDRHWFLAPMGIDLYDGLSGIALFLAYLGAVTGEERYTALARRVTRTIRRRLDLEEPAIRSIGGFAGWGGVIYALTHLATLWNDAELLAEAEALVERLLPLIEGDEHVDVISGAAGCIGGLRGLYGRTRSAKALRAAVQCGDHLIARGQAMEHGVGWKNAVGGARPLTGFSHGAAGMAWALTELAGLSGEERFREAALAALCYERSVFSPEAGNWPDFREFEEKQQTAEAGREVYMTAWCHGAPGIGLARLRMLRFLDDTAIRQEIAIALQTTVRQGLSSNHSLCHGDLGNLELLLEAGRTLNEEKWLRQADRFAALILESVEQDGWLCGNRLAVESPGLMTGIAGIGYGLLRAAEPERIPSVLTLEPPVDGRIQALAGGD